MLEQLDVSCVRGVGEQVLQACSPPPAATTTTTKKKSMRVCQMTPTCES